MRALLLIGACVAGVALLLGFTQFGGNQAKAMKPTLRVTGSATLEVRGDHFRSRESVRLTTGKRSLRTKASGNGTFVVTIPGTRCDTVSVLARGSAGSYAVVKLLPPPACAPARSG
jgi:hypothetical protein